jgi:hypothetical protein
MAAGDGRLPPNHDLPTWQRRDVDALLKRLDGVERNRAFVEGFLAAPFEKALARVPGQFHVWRLGLQVDRRRTERGPGPLRQGETARSVRDRAGEQQLGWQLPLIRSDTR